MRSQSPSTDQLKIQAKMVIEADPCIEIGARTVQGSHLVTWEWFGIVE